MQNIYETFEFYKIQEFLLEYAKTEVGRESIRDLVMLPNIDSVKEELEDLKEVLSIIQRFGPLPISPSLNAIRMLQEAKRAGILTARDLDMIAEDVLTSLALIRFMKKIEVGYPRISNKVLFFLKILFRSRICEKYYITLKTLTIYVYEWDSVEKYCV